MTLLKTILEVFHRSIIRIGRQMCLKILDMCGGGSYLTPNRTQLLNNMCSQKKFLLCKKLLMMLDVMILLTFEHLYIITAWFLIGFSERNENGNVLFEIL